jgi:hypothetical protein
MSRVKYDPTRDPVPGFDMLRTDAAREVATRTQFTGGIGQHVYVNGYDLARVEAAGLRDPAIVAILERHGWHSPQPDLRWFKDGDTTYTPFAVAAAIRAVVEELEAAATKKRAPAIPSPDPRSDTVDA